MVIEIILRINKLYAEGFTAKAIYTALKLEFSVEQIKEALGE